MEGDNYGHRQVSRRGAAPAATSSTKRSASKTEGIEMRPLLKKEPPVSASTSPTAHPGESSAKQFAESFLGQMIKLKEARKHAYNLRAKLKSKKGFHVQIPKRMLFYTVLIFLVLPLILFMYKENHIHDHDPAYDVGKTAGNHSNAYYSKQNDPRIRGGQNAKKKDNKHHNSLQQLLGSGIEAVNKTHQLANKIVGVGSAGSEDASKIQSKDEEASSTMKPVMAANAGEVAPKRKKDTDTATESIDGASRDKLLSPIKNETATASGKKLLDSQSMITGPPEEENIYQATLDETANDKALGSSSTTDANNATLTPHSVGRRNVTLPQDHVTHDEERHWFQRRLLARNITRILKQLN